MTKSKFERVIESSSQKAVDGDKPKHVIPKKSEGGSGDAKPKKPKGAHDLMITLRQLKKIEDSLEKRLFAKKKNGGNDYFVVKKQIEMLHTFCHDFEGEYRDMITNQSGSYFFGEAEYVIPDELPEHLKPKLKAKKEKKEGEEENN